MVIDVVFWKSLLLISLFSCSKLSTKVEMQGTDNRIVKIGQSFTIELDSHLGEGYTWIIANPIDTSLLFLQKKEDVKGTYLPAENAVTLPPKVKFYFEAIQVGKTKIHLSEIRPWDKGKPLNERTFQILIQNQ